MESIRLPRSIQLPRWSADSEPSGIAITSMTSSAPIVSSAVAGSARIRVCITGWPVEYDTPKSSRTKSSNQLPNWTGSESLKPISSRTASTCSWLTDSSSTFRIVSTGSPGARRMNRKLTNIMNNKKINTSRNFRSKMRNITSHPAYW
ncbi:hypothetical protein D3C74_366040 [compost metagenome]